MEERDLRPTVTANSKSSTTTKSASIAPLNIDIEARTSKSADTAATTINTPSDGREGAREHLRDVAKPTAEEDIGASNHQTPPPPIPIHRDHLYHH